MTVRREIAEPRHESGARSPEDLRRTRAVRRRSEGRARRPQACRSSESAIAAEAFMNNAGYAQWSTDRALENLLMHAHINGAYEPWWNPEAGGTTSAFSRHWRHTVRDRTHTGRSQDRRTRWAQVAVEESLSTLPSRQSVEPKKSRCREAAVRMSRAIHAASVPAIARTR